MLWNSHSRLNHQHTLPLSRTHTRTCSVCVSDKVRERERERECVFHLSHASSRSSVRRNCSVWCCCCRLCWESEITSKPCLEVTERNVRKKIRKKRTFESSPFIHVFDKHIDRQGGRIWHCMLLQARPKISYPFERSIKIMIPSQYPWNLVLISIFGIANTSGIITVL